MVSIQKRPRVAATTGDMTPKDVTSMPHDLTPEHFWAAGFLEGEGCFTVTAGYLRIVAGQNFREPLERLQRVAGGKIYQQKYRDFFTWQIGAKAEVDDALQWIYPLMSQRRQDQIDAAIEKRKHFVGSPKHLAENARRAAASRERYKNDPEWRERRKAQQRAWAKRNPGYKRGRKQVDE